MGCYEKFIKEVAARFVLGMSLSPADIYAYKERWHIDSLKVPGSIAIAHFIGEKRIAHTDADSKLEERALKTGLTALCEDNFRGGVASYDGRPCISYCKVSLEKDVLDDINDYIDKNFKRVV